MHSDEVKVALFLVVVFIFCQFASRLIWWTFKDIDYLDLVFSYTNIWLKDSILYHSSKS
jgi:hypothetical protein